MKSALGFGSLKIHKRKQSGGAGAGKDHSTGMPASPSSPVVQPHIPTGQKPTVDPPAQRIKIDVSAFGVPEEAGADADSWCKATQRCDIHALASLVEKGVLADQELDQNEHTALMMAAQEGRDDMIRFLLNNKADLSKGDKNGRNALIWAAVGGKLSTVTLLLDRGANVDAEDTDGWTALMFAACYGATEVVNLLLDSGAKQLPTSYVRASALQLAARNGHLDCIKMLIHHYPQPDHVNWADSRGWTALIEACSNGYLPIVNFLLEKGARPELTDETKRTALHIAALRGHVEVCGCLLAVMPALLDATDYFQASALLLALDQQRLPVVELLMMRKPALNKADKEGYTIAHVAALTGAISLLRTLAVADHELLEAMDHRGRTPLLLACQRGQIEAVKFLFSENVNMEHADFDGLTALSHATLGGHQLCVRFLLEKTPALLTTTDSFCRPPVDLSTKDEVREAYKNKAFPNEAYITQCIDKLQGMFKTIKVTGAFQGAEFDTNDGALELVRKTLRDSNNTVHHQQVAKFLGSALARPMTEFRNVVPAEGKVSALRAKIAASDKEAGLEAACDNLRDRGRLIVYLTDRWTRNVRVTRNMPTKADKEVISPITDMVDDYKAQIAKWEEEKANLANERADLTMAISQAATAVAPLKTRFALSFDGEHPLDSLSRYEKRVQDASDKFQKLFDVNTKRLSDDIEMLLATQHVISVQIAQQGRIFTAKLNRMKQEVDRAREEYNTKLAETQPLVEEATTKAKATFDQLMEQFKTVIADGGMVEVRKGFLADMSKIEAEVALLERLSKRLKSVSTEVESAAAQEIETSAELKLMSSTVYFERQLPKPAAAYASHKPFEVTLDLALEKDQTTPTDLFDQLESLMISLPQDSDTESVVKLAVSDLIMEPEQPAVAPAETVAAAEEKPAVMKIEPAQLPSQNSSASLASVASVASAASVAPSVAASVGPAPVAEVAAPVVVEEAKVEEKKPEAEAVAEPKKSPSTEEMVLVDPKKLPSRQSSKPQLVVQTSSSSIGSSGSVEAVSISAVGSEKGPVSAIKAQIEAGELTSAKSQVQGTPASGVQAESMPNVATLLAKFESPRGAQGKTSTLRSRSTSPEGRAVPQVQPNSARSP